MELGEQEANVRKLGYGVAALSYDSPELLADFARRKNLRYPLLSDRESKTIDAFGLRNTAVTVDFMQGIPHPGIFILSPDRRVIVKHFEEDYRERLTIAAVLSGQFGQRIRAAERQVEGKRLKVTTSATTAVVKPGQRIRLTIDGSLGNGLHVYAPGAPPDFIPISWKLAESPDAKAAEPCGQDI